MKGIIKIQKRKPILVGSAFLMLIILAWMGGRGFGWPVNTRLLAVLIILFGGVLLLLFKSMRANRDAASLERSIKMQAEDQKRSIRPEKKAEIEELERELLVAIESLKNSRLGRGRSGRAALYSLPWYMFIGPPAAGKTTAIINSGLEFSFGSDIKGVGGTRNCDWFFSNSAILLDTAGRYITEDEDKEEWLAFLDILKKHRRRSPINGVIIGMSIADLLKASLDELEWHARNIRRRIDELIQRLGVRFPVYLVITKLDLLQGFVESFEQLSRTEREQIWGCTLSPEEVSSSSPREVFEQEFDLLAKALDDFRLKRLSLPSKRESRGRMYVFPLEFTGIKESVGQFIGKLFQPSPYQEVPIFRGFYFTSGTQEGVPIDRVIQAVAKQFDLPSEMISEPEVQKKSYFIRKIFTDIIIPDRNLVARTSRAATQSNWIRAGVIFGSLICLGAFIFGVSQGYVRSRSSLKSAKDMATLIKDVNWKSQESYVENLKQLDRFREQLVGLEQKEMQHPLIRSGMSRTGMVLEAARKLYYRKGSPFIEYYYQGLERRLKEFREGGDYPDYAIRESLKAYLLMGEESPRLDGPYSDFLKKELMGIPNRKISNESAEEISPLVERQIEYFVQSFGKEGMSPFDNDKNLVQSIRTLINKPIDLEEDYQRFIREIPQEKLPQPITLSQILKGQPQDLVSCEFKVPGSFTKAGWENYIKEAIEAWSQIPEKESWILGQAQTVGPDLRDPKQRSAGLRELYFQEYSRNWWQFLQSIRYAPFEDLSSASEALKKLSDLKESPLKLILDAVARQTRFEIEPTSEGLLAKVSKGASKILKAPVQKKAAKFALDKVSPGSSKEGLIQGINEEFAKLQSLSPAIGGKEESPKELGDLLGQYAILKEKLQYIESDPGLKAKEVAVPVLEKQGGELPDAMKVIHTALPESDFDAEARTALFEQPLRNVWGVILKEVRNGLNERWRSNVYQLYTQTLASYYPFDPQGKDDAPIIEVGRFFDPKEGIIGKFINEELKPFVKLDTWKPITWMDQGLSLSTPAVAALEKAGAIRQALFETGSLKVNFSLMADFPEPVGVRDENKKKEIKSSIDQISLDIDGKPYSYRMGLRSWEDFSWPGTEGSLGTRLTISSRKYNYESKKSDGAWGWFRLLDKAEIVEVAPTECNIRWIFGQPDINQVRIQYRLKTKSPFHPFRDTKDFFRLQLPETLTLDGFTEKTESHVQSSILLR
jgi:type VI secretion system protein ImpL